MNLDKILLLCFIKRSRGFTRFLLLILGFILQGTFILGEESKPPVEDIFYFTNQLGQGINFGNALEAPNEGDWGVKLEERYFDLVKEAGFKTIRLPVKWSAHAQNKPPYTIDPSFLRRVDWAVQNATDRNLNIIVDFHHFDELIQDPENQRPRFIAIWTQIAEHYQSQPSSVFFELLNEPKTRDSTLWNEIITEVLPVIRSTNPQRPLIIGGVEWNSFSKLSPLNLPEEDRFIIGTFHYYLPHHFTHQGASFAKGSTAWLGTKWIGSEEEKGAIRSHLDQVMKWSRKEKRPVFLGEFGTISKAEMESRCRWTEFMVRECDSLHIPWAYWSFGADFGVYDCNQKKWYPDILKSLFYIQ